MAVARKPPVRTTGAVGWLRENLFSSPVNSIITVIVGALLVWVGVSLVRWVLTDAYWTIVWQNLKLLAVYRYPTDLLWRPLSVVALVMALLGLSAGVARRSDGGEIIAGVFWWFAGLAFFLTAIALFSWESVRLLWLGVSVASLAGYAVGYAAPRVVRALPWLWGASLLVAAILLYGVAPEGGLEVVSPREWGGFMLTLILAAVGIVVSFPLGILLALGRRSNLPAIKVFCIAFIEIVRGAPLISWLFIASLMVPLLLGLDSPDSIPALTRALVAITLFSSAYMAENVRGGLQAVPKGQTEAARALGLSGWQTTRKIVLPQALRAVIPAIVGQAIGLFKDTSLVFIVGLLDFFEIGRRVIPTQPEALQVSGGVVLELFLFMAVVYWFFAYRMSVASRQLERKLGVGTR